MRDLVFRGGRVVGEPTGAMPGRLVRGPQGVSS